MDIPAKTQRSLDEVRRILAVNLKDASPGTLLLVKDTALRVLFVVAK